MATGRMQKILIAGFRREAEGFLRELQGLALFHPASAGDLHPPAHPPGESPAEIPDRDRLHRVEEIIQFLKSYLPPRGIIRSLGELPEEKEAGEFYSLARGEQCRLLLERAEILYNKIEDQKERGRELLGRLEDLEPLRGISLPLDRLPVISRAVFTAGRVSLKKLSSLLAEPWLQVELLETGPGKALVLMAVHRDEAARLQEAVSKYNIEEIDLKAFKESPDILYQKFQEYLEQTTHELKTLEKQAVELALSHDELLVLLEYLLSLENRRSLMEKWVLTPHTFIMAGWIPETGLSLLEKLQRKFTSVEIELIEADEKELPPVHLENVPPARPFELITRLYSFPRYGSVDPSGITGIFFALFFGLCLTDAGYGLILAILALTALKKIRAGRDLLWILFWGGIATVGAGLATGGIFGDLFRSSDPYLRLEFLGRFRDSFLLFDPMRSPMVFFRLVLFLGLVHVVTGLVIGVFHAIRERRFLDALADHASWLVIVLALVGILFATEMCLKMALVTGSSPPLPQWLVVPASWGAGGMALVVFLFGGRDESSLFFRFFIGFLKLIVLSGIFSYLGDILSYIRLMALGMVTAGIAMAINTIAFMLADIPVVGILLTVIILVLGHTFNMAINLLGGFVHTLRLQYVEFFSKFFTGGGKVYRPLSYDNRYVKII